MTNKQTFHLLQTAFILIALFTSNVFAAHALPEFSAKYAIQKFNTKLAEAHYRLSYTDKGYKFTQDTKLYGIAGMFASDTVSAVSYINEVDNNLLLTSHSYKQTGRKRNKNEDFDILWNTHKNALNGEITGVVRSEKISLRTHTAIWEALSFQIPLMIEANENIKEYPYNAILKGKIDNYNFILTASKKIIFADKEYKALHLIRTDPDKNRQLHIWLIPALNNIPIIIENYRDGKEHSRMQLESVSFNNETPYTNQQIDDDDEL